jgi:glycine/D-amino acid oxidase-like deaminating enzyme
MALPNVPVWDDAPAAEYPPLVGAAEADVCVVGLGGSGLAAVHELLARGRRVVGLDAGTVAGGAAGRNGGFLLAGPADFHHDAVAKHGRARAVALYHLTLAEIDRIAADPAAGVRRTGSIRLAASPEEAEDCRAQLDAMRADGLPAEWYDGPLGTGLRIPTDASFQPLARARGMAARAAAAGARLHERSPAAIAAGEVRTPDGVVRCGAVVVAVDGRLELLLPELAGRVRSARLQMLATAPTDEVRVPGPCTRAGATTTGTSAPTAPWRWAAAATSTRPRSGPPAPSPRRPSRRRSTACCARAWGVRTAAVTHRWAAVVGYTADGLPYLARSARGVGDRRVQRHGNVVGALCGRAARAAGLRPRPTRRRAARRGS